MKPDSGLGYLPVCVCVFFFIRRLHTCLGPLTPVSLGDLKHKQCDTINSKMFFFSLPLLTTLFEIWSIQKCTSGLNVRVEARSGWYNINFKKNSICRNTLNWEESIFAKHSNLPIQGVLRPKCTLFTWTDNFPFKECIIYAWYVHVMPSATGYSGVESI